MPVNFIYNEYQLPIKDFFQISCDITKIRGLSNLSIELFNDGTTYYS